MDQRITRQVLCLHALLHLAHQGPAGLVVLGNVVVVGVVGILHITLTHLKAGVTGVLGMFMSTAGLLGGGDSLDEDDRAGREASL